MVIQLDNKVNVKLPNFGATKSSNAISFKASTNPILTGKVAFKGEQESVISWPQGEGLAQVKFSDTNISVLNPKAGAGEVVHSISSGKGSNKKNHIVINGKDSILANVELERGVNPKDIQVGYQDNKGGFALKLWDAKTKTAYVLFDNGKNDPAVVNIQGRLKAVVNPAGQTIKKGISFTGNKISEAELNAKIADAYVIGMFGGFGTRLVGVSHPNTKPSTKLGKYTFQNNMLGVAQEAGYKNAGCSLYHGADIAKADIEGSGHDMTISYAQQNEKTGNLGTAGAVRHTVEHMIANEVADSLKGLGSAEAKTQLEKELSSDLASAVWDKIKDAGKNYDQALRAIVPEIPELRAKIFDEKVDKVPFIAVVSGDHVTDINMKEFAREHLENNANFTIAVKEIDDNIKSQGGDKCPYGCAVITDPATGKIEGFKEKPYWKQKADGSLNEDKVFNPESDKWINTGIYMLSPAALKEIPSEAAIKEAKAKAGEGAKAEGSDFGKNIIPTMLQKHGQLQSFRFNDHWVDVGNNMALQQEIQFLVDEIHNKGGASRLLPNQEFKSTNNAAVSKKADVKELILKQGSNPKVLISDKAKTGKIKVDGTVYVGPGAEVPSGQYKNVWIDRLEQPLFKPKLCCFA